MAIDKISQVQLSDLLPMTEKYLKPLFTENHACAVVCPLGQVSAVTESLNK